MGRTLEVSLQSSIVNGMKWNDTLIEAKENVCRIVWLVTMPYIVPMLKWWPRLHTLRNQINPWRFCNQAGLFAIVIYGQVYWQNKNEGWQNQESEGFYVFIRLFWEFYGQWGVLMCCRSSLSSFFCEGPGFYFGEVRPKAEPNQNKTLAPNKKKLDKLLRQHIRTSKLPWNSQKSLMTT